MSGLVATYDMDGKAHQVSLESVEMSISVYGVALDSDQALVLPSFDGYDWPGGKVEKGEDHIDALKREFKEETGLDVEPEKLINVYTSLFHYKLDENFHALLVFYFVKVIGGEISDKNFSKHEKIYAKTARWETLDNIAKMHYSCNLENVGDEMLRAIRSKKRSKND